MAIEVAPWTDDDHRLGAGPGWIPRPRPVRRIDGSDTRDAAGSGGRTQPVDPVREPRPAHRGAGRRPRPCRADRQAGASPSRWLLLRTQRPDGLRVGGIGLRHRAFRGPRGLDEGARRAAARDDAHPAVGDGARRGRPVSGRRRVRRPDADVADTSGGRRGSGDAARAVPVGRDRRPPDRSRESTSRSGVGMSQRIPTPTSSPG
jgi:hypothetical protein